LSLFRVWDLEFRIYCIMPTHLLAGNLKVEKLVMKSYREEIWFETKKKKEFINITPQVNAALKKSGVREGLCLVNAMHITASVFINDDEPGLLKDFEDFLEKIAPYDLKGYRHHRTGEDNGDAHQLTVHSRIITLAGAILERDKERGRRRNRSITSRTNDAIVARKRPVSKEDLNWADCCVAPPRLVAKNKPSSLRLAFNPN